MRFVDTHDQMISLYRIGRVSKKWWHPIFYNLLDCTIINAWILMKDHNNCDIEQNQFRIRLATELIGAYSCRKRQMPTPIPAPLTQSDKLELKNHAMKFMKNNKRRCECAEMCGERVESQCQNCHKFLHKDHRHKVPCV